MSNKLTEKELEPIKSHGLDCECELCQRGMQETEEEYFKTHKPSIEQYSDPTPY